MWIELLLIVLIFSFIYFLHQIVFGELFGFKGFEGTWTKVEPEEKQTWTVNIPYKKPHIQIICSLTFDSPYYDCNDLWIIFMVYGEVDGVVCNPGSAGCAYYGWNIIWMEDKKFLDPCDRTILQHEILHLKYGKGATALIHDEENCVMW